MITVPLWLVPTCVGALCFAKPAARDELPALRPARIEQRLVTDEPEMPWIWQVLRREVYARMPRYEKEREFTLVLSPVVVKSQSDTVPGVGVAGDF